MRSSDLDRVVINPTICSRGFTSEITWDCNFHCMVLMPEDYNAGCGSGNHVKVEDCLTNEKGLKTEAVTSRLVGKNTQGRNCPYFCKPICTLLLFFYQTVKYYQFDSTFFETQL